MNRDNLLFLLGGLAFGILVGFGAYHAVHTAPDLGSAGSPQGSTGSPQGGMTGSPQQGSGGAPMVARVNDLKRMLQEKPNDDRVLAALGNLHYDAGMWQQAAGYYERAAEANPNADLLTDLGVCYREMGDYERALDAFSRAHALDPTHWQSLYNTMVVAAFDVGRFGLARQALAAIEAIDPRPAELDQSRLDELRKMLGRLAGESERPS